MIEVRVTPSPSVTGTFRSDPPDTLQVVGAMLAIALAVAAAVVGYRIIRGGRGL